LAVEKVFCHRRLLRSAAGRTVLGREPRTEGGRAVRRARRKGSVSERILIGKTAHEWFREMIADALSHRRMEIQEVTEFYLVNLLAGFLEREKLFVEEEDGTVAAEPLALILLRALEGDRALRAARLRRLGDTALFVSGFFGDSIARSVVDVDYYIAMGERAYGTLAETERRAGLDDLYGELSGRFPQFVDLFAEIAELSDLRSNRGLVRLYERYLVSRDARVAKLLRERGVALFGGPGVSKKGRLPQ
jgi:hypothetical protein